MLKNTYLNADFVPVDKLLSSFVRLVDLDFVADMNLDYRSCAQPGERAYAAVSHNCSIFTFHTYTTHTHLQLVYQYGLRIRAKPSNSYFLFFFHSHSLRVAAHINTKYGLRIRGIDPIMLVMLIELIDTDTELLRFAYTMDICHFIDIFFEW